MKCFFCVFLFLFIGLSTVFSQAPQKKMDSLVQAAKTANDSTRLAIYNDLGFYYIFNEPEKAKSFLQKGLRETTTPKTAYSKTRLTNTLGIYYDVQGVYDSAQFYFKKALLMSKDYGFADLEARCTNGLGMSNWNQGNYQNALDYFFEALALNRKYGTPDKDDTYLNNIGLIYQDMNMADKALEYHQKALAIRREYKKTKDIPVSLNNIAINLQDKGDFKEAEKMLVEGRNLAKEVGNQDLYFDLTHTLASLYQKTNRTDLAIPLLQEVIDGRLATKIGVHRVITSINNLAEAYILKNNLKEALKVLKKGENLIQQFPEQKVSISEYYYAVSQANFLNNDPEKGNEYFIKAIALRDSIFSQQNAENTAALETKFNISEKERALAETRANLAERELEVEQKNNLIFGSLGLALLLGLIGYLFYKQQKLKNRQLQKESELKTALAKIATQNQLQEQRLRISRDLHDNIGSQLTFIISSIDNLKYGLEGAATSVTDKLGRISEFASQTIYELRDTIWAMNKTDISVEDLQARISNFIEKAKVSSDVNFQFDVAENVLREKHFTSVEGMNIYRIIQEAVNNALKYSEATQIQVSLSKAPLPVGEGSGVGTSFKVEITDNGKGFDMEKTSFGNGIANIKKRAKDLGGNVAITSEIDRGTVVRLIF
ncbi:sensor histidine kinase [Aequorivita todarodis]|uniref:tetratricopeptide repeat-containing sensor histidine kinase n=1 Tax=Aequorivita todarodis TaxID=2036821 RepID=UPI00234FBDF0|nr:sensor histidine kinase [Aequorivita todarodis]MDC8001074.1 sensor histidine kinase [Aequorivita todarodis]